MTSTARYPQPLLALGASLTLCGALMGHRYRLLDGPDTRTNIMVLGLALWLVYGLLSDSRYAYRPSALDDALSADIFKRYLEALDGGKVFFLGLVDTGATFTTVTFSSVGFPADFVFNIDDITGQIEGRTPEPVPEPATLLLMASGLAAAYRSRRKREEDI